MNVRRWLLLFSVVWTFFLAQNLQGQEKPVDFIADQAGVMPEAQRALLAAKLRAIAKSDSVEVYFVSYETLPERGANDPVTRLPERWIGDRLGTIFFLDASENRYFLTLSPGLITALGSDRMRSLSEALEGLDSRNSLGRVMEDIADAVLLKVRESRTEAAGALPERSMEWDPARESWEPLLSEQERKKDALLWATALDDEAVEPLKRPLKGVDGESGEAELPWVPILGGVVVLGLGGFYMVNLLRHENILKRAYPVPPASRRVEPRFGALASGGHGATVDLRKDAD